MATVVPPPPHRLSQIFAWRRLAVVLSVATLMGLLLSPGFDTTSTRALILREMLVGMTALLAFGVFETWPARLPRWLSRWALQVFAVALSIPIATWIVYLIVTQHDAVPFWQTPKRMTGYAIITMTGLLIAPWIAVSAIFRQRDFVARSQALAFELERSELERKALDARLRLLQAQVEPHFLFNTLANVRELVVAGSPQASSVLECLIAYLRAAVPRLHEPATTLGQESQLVRAYLELMHMRMPDRLRFTLQIDPAALDLRCPPTTLLTLVENAVRHGIDPSEEGGRIDVRVELKDGRCRAQVSDTGIGLQAAGNGLGTGLSTLRERLHLVYGGKAELRLSSIEPRGVVAEVEFPAENALP